MAKPGRVTGKRVTFAESSLVMEVGGLRSEVEAIRRDCAMTLQRCAELQVEIDELKKLLDRI